MLHSIKKYLDLTKACESFKLIGFQIKQLRIQRLRLINIVNDQTRNHRVTHEFGILLIDNIFLKIVFYYYYFFTPLYTIIIKLNYLLLITKPLRPKTFYAKKQTKFNAIDRKTTYNRYYIFCLEHKIKVGNCAKCNSGYYNVNLAIQIGTLYMEINKVI